MQQLTAAAAAPGVVVGRPHRHRSAVAALALPAAIGAAALAARLYGLGEKPFWLDEVATLHRATGTFHDMVTSALHANHSPAYFVLAWLTAKIGTSQAMLRLPSAVFGALTAAITCGIGRSLAGARAGAAAGLLLALSPFAVQFGQEARSYTLVSCLIMLALQALLTLARNPETAAVPLWQSDARRSAWAVYALSTAAALDVLNAAVPWLLAANIGAIFIAHSAGARARLFWRNWGLVHLGIAALWLPMLAAIYFARQGAVIDDVGWAWPASGSTVWSVVGPVLLLRISNFITAGTAPAPIQPLSLFIVLLAAAGIWRLRRNLPSFAVLTAAIVVLPLSLGLLSLLVPVLVPRYFLWSGPPFFILAGIGLAQLAAVPNAAAQLGLTAACLINLAPYYGYETKPRWDLLAAQLAANARPGDAVLLNSYYAYWVLTAFPEAAALGERGIKLSWRQEDFMPLPGHTLWAVYGRTGPAVSETAPQFQASLGRLDAPPAAQPIGRYIELWRYAGAETGGLSAGETDTGAPAGDAAEPCSGCRRAAVAGTVPAIAPLRPRARR
jgi:mannosyltransferase